MLGLLCRQFVAYWFGTQQDGSSVYPLGLPGRAYPLPSFVLSAGVRLAQGKLQCHGCKVVVHGDARWRRRRLVRWHLATRRRLCVGLPRLRLRCGLAGHRVGRF